MSKISETGPVDVDAGDEAVELRKRKGMVRRRRAHRRRQFLPNVARTRQCLLAVPLPRQRLSNVGARLMRP